MQGSKYVYYRANSQIHEWSLVLMVSLVKILISLLTREQLRKLVFLQVLIVFAACLETISVMSIAPFMSVVVDQDVLNHLPFVIDFAAYFGFSTASSAIKLMGVSVIALLTFSSLTSMFTIWQVSLFAARFGMELGDRLFSLYMRSGWLFHTRANTSDLVKKISDDCLRISDNVISPFLLINARCAVCLLIGAAMIAYNTVLAVSGLLILSIAYMLIYFGLKKMLIKNAEIVTGMSAKRYRLLMEGFSSIKDVILRGNYSFFTNSFSSAGSSLAEARGTNLALALTPRYAMELVIFGSLITLILVILSGGDGEFMSSLPTLTFFGFAVFRLMPCLQQVYASSAQIKGNEHAFRSIEEDLINASKVSPNNDSSAVKVPKLLLDFKVSLDNISFKYPASDDFALSNINLEFVKGEITGIVGDSGSGKSTLGDLLLGLINPTSGRIAVDDTLITANNCADWREIVGYVPQSVSLLDTSFVNNIAFGIDDGDIDIGLVEAVIRDADIADLVASESAGIYGFIGEAGVRISGGQRQRLALARALYRDFQFIVFDEATSALDSATQERVMTSIMKLKEKSSIVLITHSSETLKYCDNICVLQHGKVLDFGSRDSVMSRMDK